MPLLEVHLPLRNPTAVLERTIGSLAAQSTRDFTVVLSDNHSTTGGELIDGACRRLQEAGLLVRRTAPARELQRVEHWNWLHASAEAPWIKPLFAGDWLEPGCVAAFLEMFARHPEAGLVHCGYRLHREGERPIDTPPAAARGFRPPAEMKEAILRLGHQFGPPSAYAFATEAFRAVGGYRPTLPITADCLFCCTVAARFGVAALPELLSNFFIHGARFSTDLLRRRRVTLGETVTYYGLLAYHGWTEREPVPWAGVARLFARATRDYLYDR